jgi:superfamily II DNA or RNA helicase
MQQNRPVAPKKRTNLTSLERLERQLQAITPSRAQGDAWEKALKGWINAGGHPELTKAWMWGEWPGKLKAGLKGDKGVDLVAETRDKQLVAIQVKFREDPNDPVTAPEVQKLVGSYRKHFTLFALASNAWSATRGVSEAVGDEDAMLILREQLLESSYDWAAKKSIKRTKFTPFPFQKLAAENVRKALEKGGRAQIVMACGTGKTVTMLLAAEALDAQRVLVLAPTLLLVKQLRDEWISKRRPDREWASLAVCSDIGDGMDASEIAPAEFGAPPTTNPDDIAAFLKKPGRRVVFGTYASSDRIAKAQKKAGVPSFDLAVADEAHRIAGVVSAKDKSERSQRVMLEEKEIKAVRRLFATATPRITGSKQTRDGDEILLESMDDESRFGKVAHSVTFQEAVKLKRLVPYKLVVTIVTNDEVADAVQNRRFIDVNGKPYAADEVATAIAIRRAYKDLGISKIISYHSRVAGARAFADLITQVPGRGKAPVTEHVAGSMPVNDRRQVLNRLAAATEPYLVTNARCLTEGIDVPALDAVAFADPRRSQVDIVQAVGRAMRRPMGTSKKMTGYIILPVYLTKKELKDPETAVEGSAFEPVLQVLRALKDHDPFMARFMAKILVAKGKKPHQKTSGIEEILEVSIGAGLDKVLARQLFNAVQLRAVEVAADGFDIRIQLLQTYKAREGNVRVPRDHIEGGYKLGQWCLWTRQKYKQGLLSPEQSQQLESLGFSWSPYDDDYDLGLTSLQAYIARHNDPNPPRGKMVGAFDVGLWVHARRGDQRKGKLRADRVEELRALGVSFNRAEELAAETWSQALEALTAFKKRTGHLLVPALHQEGEFHLGRWVNNIRTKHKKHGINEQQQRQLERLGFAWVAADVSWSKAIRLLEDYVKREGHANVPQTFRVGDVKLGTWLNTRRKMKRKGALSAAEMTELERLGVVWEPSKSDWISGIESLTTFIERQGRFPAGTVGSSDEAKLARWMVNKRQERRQGRLAQDRIRALDRIGFSWDTRDEAWLDAISRLKTFKKLEGHCVVPVSYEVDGVRLGHWLSGVRGKAARGLLSAERRSELQKLGVKLPAAGTKGKRHGPNQLK